MFFFPNREFRAFLCHRLILSLGKKQIAKIDLLRVQTGIFSVLMQFNPCLLKKYGIKFKGHISLFRLLVISLWHIMFWSPEIFLCEGPIFVI